MMNSVWIFIPLGILFVLIGVGNLVTGRLHPERPSARMSVGLSYVGIAVGMLWVVFGLLATTGILVPSPVPQAPGSAPANALPAAR